MRTFYKIIIISAFIIVGLFLILHFFGNNLISNLAPDINLKSNINLNSKISVGSKIPYFNLPSLSVGRVNSDDLIDSPAIVTFWATWNSESVDQIKIIDDYNSRVDVNSPKVRIITIDSQEAKATIENILRRGGYKIEVLADINGNASNAFGVETLPTTFFVDKEGKIQDIFVGTMSEKDIVDKIDKIIS